MKTSLQLPGVSILNEAYGQGQESSFLACQMFHDKC